MGIIVGILSLLVTFLLGWNIVQALKIDEKVKKITEMNKENGRMFHFLDQFVMASSDHNQALTLHLNKDRLSKKDKTECFKLSVSSLYHFIQCTGYTGIGSNIDTVINLIINVSSEKDLDYEELKNDDEFMDKVRFICLTPTKEFAKEKLNTFKCATRFIFK